MEFSNPCATPMILSNKLASHDSPLFDHPSLYQSTLGALQYLTYTRPDISFTISKLSQFLQAPNVNHWKACKHLLRYIRGTPSFGLTFTPASVLKLEGFSDADWASNLDDRKSTPNLIAWSSRKQRVVALSSTESEYRALSSASGELIWVHNLLHEVGLTLQTYPPVLWCDNRGAQALAMNPVYHARTKHVDLDVHLIRDLIATAYWETGR